MQAGTTWGQGPDMSSSGIPAHLRVSKSTCCEATWKPSRGRFMYKKSV